MLASPQRRIPGAPAHVHVAFVAPGHAVIHAIMFHMLMSHDGVQNEGMRGDWLWCVEGYCVDSC